MKEVNGKINYNNKETPCSFEHGAFCLYTQIKFCPPGYPESLIRLFGNKLPKIHLPLWEGLKIKCVVDNLNGSFGFVAVDEHGDFYFGSCDHLDVDVRIRKGFEHLCRNSRMGFDSGTDN